MDSAIRAAKVADKHNIETLVPFGDGFVAFRTNVTDTAITWEPASEEVKHLIDHFNLHDSVSEAVHHTLSEIGDELEYRECKEMESQ